MYGSEDSGSDTPTTGMHKREFRESSVFNKLYGPIVSFFSLFRQDSVLISSGMHSGILAMYPFFRANRVCHERLFFNGLPIAEKPGRVAVMPSNSRKDFFWVPGR